MAASSHSPSLLQLITLTPKMYDKPTKRPSALRSMLDGRLGDYALIQRHPVQRIAFITDSDILLSFMPTVPPPPNPIVKSLFSSMSDRKCQGHSMLVLPA